jgi:hypothetical protein
MNARVAGDIRAVHRAGIVVRSRECTPRFATGARHWRDFIEVHDFRAAAGGGLRHDIPTLADFAGGGHT